MLHLSLAVVVSQNRRQRRRAVVTLCPLLLALVNLTDAELCKSDEFNIIRYFRFLHPGCLQERKQRYQNTDPTQTVWLRGRNLHPYQFKCHIFVVLRIIDDLLQIGSNWGKAEEERASNSSFLITLTSTHQGCACDLPMTRSLPSTRPAETNSWETPSAESEHRKRKSPAVRASSERISEKRALAREPLPDMNSNRMSLSSFLEFLSLRTRLMGTLVLAAAGSYNQTTWRAHKNY